MEKLFAVGTHWGRGKNQFVLLESQWEYQADPKPKPTPKGFHGFFMGGLALFVLYLFVVGFFFLSYWFFALMFLGEGA